MSTRKNRTGLWVAIFVVSVLLVAGFVGMHYAGKTLKAQIEQALGEDSEVGDISLGLSAVTVSDLRIKAPPGWPAQETLRAARIVVSPDWQALLSRKIAVRRIELEGGYLSILRTPDGKMRLLPSLLEKEKKGSGPPPEVSIDKVELKDAAVEFYDASVKRPPHRMSLFAVNAKLDKLHLPDLKGFSDLDLEGKIKGVHSDGSFSVKGQLEVASKDSEIKTAMRGVDLIALQPYLVKAAETGIKRGTLDLDVDSKIKNRRLHAPGTVTLHDLELDTEGSILGLPRQAAVGALKDGKDDIQVSFVLDGNLDDPKFSLNESIAMKFGAGLAEALGVSISSLGKTVGSAASSVGSAIKGLFGK